MAVRTPSFCFSTRRKANKEQGTNRVRRKEERERRERGKREKRKKDKKERERGKENE